MVQKAVNAEAKAGLKSSAMVRDTDIRYSWDHRPFNNTASKVQIQKTSAKGPEESRSKKAKLAKEKTPALPRTTTAESSELDKKDKKNKKRSFQEKRE